jgi:uncharacterized protein (TIGR02266 family)
MEAKAERLPAVLTRLIAKIRNHTEEFLFLESVAREGLNFLQAHRSIIYVFDEPNQIFKPQCSLTSDAKYETMGESLEREFARKMTSFCKPGLVKSSKDFFKILNRESVHGQVTSVTSAPFAPNEKPMGAILAVRFQDQPPFDDFDRQVISLLADLISMRMEDFFLHQEVEKSDQLRKTHERYLDDLLAKLQTNFALAAPVPQTTESLPSPLPQPPPRPEEEEEDTGIEGIISLQEADPRNRRQDERVETMVRVEFEDHDVGLTDNLSCGGAFVRTLTPLDLGEEFSMLLHLHDGHEPLALHCKVMWTNQFGNVTKDLQRGMGVRFQNLSADEQARINAYIEQQKARRSAEALPNGQNAKMS